MVEIKNTGRTVWVRFFGMREFDSLREEPPSPSPTTNLTLGTAGRILNLEEFSEVIQPHHHVNKEIQDLKCPCSEDFVISNSIARCLAV